ncbi:MAG: hypothetical protein ABFD94_06790 [Armatimonadia bacterium]
MAHTPGPWRVALQSDYAWTEINVDAGTRAYVCTCGHKGDVEAEANARLIAAAPELLTACRELRVLAGQMAPDSLRHCGEILRDADAAINHATGE